MVTKTAVKLETVAFLTYNTVGDGTKNGWHEGTEGRKAFILEGELSPEARNASKGTELDAYIKGVRSTVDSLWAELNSVLDSIDHVVVYLGAKGSEGLVELARKLDPSRITFVACNCGVPQKAMLIMMMGMADSGIVPCECGGRKTMKLLFNDFMKMGEFSPKQIRLAEL